MLHRLGGVSPVPICPAKAPTWSCLETICLKLVEVLRIARRWRHIILTNFAGTLLVDSVGVGLAGLGFLNPVLAAIIHVSSEIVFTLNSARLLAPSKSGT